jgi:hypothetical protein
MLAVNQQSPGHVNVETTIVDFWRRRTFPTQPRTFAIRRGTLTDRFGATISRLILVSGGLREDRTQIGSQFLTSLSKTLSRHTLQHIRLPACLHVEAS